MIPAAFDYLAPTSLQEALSLLQEHGDAAKLLAGGHSLIPMMKLRLAQPALLIDLNRVEGLDYVEERDGFLCIGAMAREEALESTPVVREKYPLLHDTALMIADPQVRNLATVGGNLAHSDPANDHPATMLAYDARVKAVGPNGERTIAVREFFTDFFTTALDEGEILTEIQIPAPGPRSGGAYFKLERKVGDFATAGVAVQLALDENGHCDTVGIGLTNVAPIPMRAKRAESLLHAESPTDAAIDEAARLAAEDCDPTADLRGPVAYKRAMVEELTKRALRKALQRARG